MAGDTGMAGKVALLLWAQTLGLAGWCPLSPAGAQNTQLLVEPPWRPAVLWDWVTLTCQGSGTAGSTTWYKDGQRFGLQGHDRFKVNTKGNYWCDRPGTGLSPPINVSEDFLVLQVPARALLEGDTVTLRCRGWRNSTITSVSFYHEGKELGGLHNGTQLSLSLLQLNHSGRYSCKGQMDYWGWKESAPVTVTVKVHGEEVTAPNPTPSEPLQRYSGSAIPLPSPSLSSSQCQCWSVPPEPSEGSPLTPSCLSTPSPLQPRACLLHVFYRNRQVVGGPQGSPQLLVPPVGVSHSGNSSRQVRSKGGECAEEQRPAPKCACGQCHHHPQSPGTPGSCR
ncbi:low affinity immunoglobulin gamma Fc region receptor II-like isoform X2 [Motacilla alba alba]|uniref:low affinity immunoglobulin gamma Fc region receptor II-like isoform X2 n=1 Tax=Motacilla alba alba TaxID=1094192 RepID=UPI0018D4FBF6|nr:low affinity immunoglobulin gamma Fc region receptor II-like isoform X2 [Motacilla alba alba]